MCFVRDIEPTEQEWMTAIEWLTRTGQLSTDKRQEFILASDVVGVSMLVDCINHRVVRWRDTDDRDRSVPCP